LIGAPRQKVRAWVSGWPRSGTAPLVHNDLGWVDDRLAFSFANLMELRFIAVFTRGGVKIREIRTVMEEAQREMQMRHPFATNLVFKTDGRRIIAEIAPKKGVTHLYDLRSKNFEIGGIVYDTLKDDVVYDPLGEAEMWFPLKKLAPNVVIHPRLAFGRPVLRNNGIPIEAIADAVKAERSIDTVASNSKLIGEGCFL
jgi:hypothetical protein